MGICRAVVGRSNGFQPSPLLLPWRLVTEVLPGLSEAEGAVWHGDSNSRRGLQESP